MDNNAIIKFFKPLKDSWDNLEKKKRIRYIILAGIILLVIVVSVLVLGHKEYVVLYSNLQSDEAGEIINKLSDMKVDAKAQGTGTILVPKDQEAELRMQLSAEGYPKSGLNYDLFKNSTGFGTTDFEKQKYMQFQLQDRLQSAIKSLDIVDDAIVTLNIPESTAFVLKSDKQTATASVILKLKSGSKLSTGQVKGITGLVAKSVPGLSEDQVLIIDNQGNSLNKASSTETEVAGTQLELENTISDKYKEQIQSMLEPVFGNGKVIVGVRVSLDFDKKTTETTKYEPLEGSSNGIPVSVNESKETATGTQTAGNVGQDANGGATSYTQTQGDNGSYQKTDKTVNYEINQIKEMLQKSQGNISDMSVSIILDNANLQTGAADKVKQIVAGATGISPEKVTVQTMDFSGNANSMEEIFNNAKATNEYLQKQAFMRNAIIYGILGLAVLLIFLILLIKRRKREEEYSFEAVADEDVLGSSGLDMDDETGFSVKKSEQRRLIEKSIDNNPEFVAQLLRNWLDEYGGK
ncbi:MAG: flagellar basal-body MS-ring/collar protein FliF [Clostridia bacterium]|nr:flagellar basal-body MS-ring/collar protein FliF [Clostridia bacterium]